MGRKTLESFPNGLPPKNSRTNIVITGDHTYKAKDAIIDAVLRKHWKNWKKYDSNDIYVIGGESIYRQLLPYCDVAHVTCMDHTYQADTWFPNLDEDKDWVVAADSEERTYFDWEYCFQNVYSQDKIKKKLLIY